ncbi:MAG TPA: hypothetical protein V6C65_04380 [Allocoleopsis sp.]
MTFFMGDFATAEFRKSRSDRGRKRTLGSDVRTGLKRGALLGGGLGAVLGGRLAYDFAVGKSPTITPKVLREAAAYGASRGALGGVAAGTLLGGGLATGTYGAKKAIDAVRGESRKKSGDLDDEA